MKDSRFLFCHVGTKIVALPLASVQEILRPQPVEPLPGVPPFIQGLAIIRGLPTPVVDATRLLSSTASASQPSRFVLLTVGSRTAALAVSAVLNVQTLSGDLLTGMPPLLQAAADCIAAVAALDTELLLVLEASRLVPGEVFEAIHAARAAG